MKQLAEILPIALFFIAYQMDGQHIELLGYSHEFDGIYSATAVLMLATAAQVLFMRLLTGEVEKRLWVLFAAVVVFGSATLLLRNELFIQWKPTVFNWALALAFFAAPLLSDKTLLQRAIGDQLELPTPIWRRLNTLWYVYFFVVGALNLIVAYNFPESFWVSYKLYSAIGFTILISLATAALIAPHIQEDSDQETE